MSRVPAVRFRSSSLPLPTLLLVCLTAGPAAAADPVEAFAEQPVDRPVEETAKQEAVSRPTTPSGEAAEPEEEAPAVAAHEATENVKPNTVVRTVWEAPDGGAL